MPLFDLTEFFKLSSALNYNLSAASLNRYNVLMYITDNKRLDDDDTKDREKKSIVMEALGYLFSAYRQKRRHLGPMAVLHPLRAAALYTRIRPSLDLVELLTLNQAMEKLAELDSREAQVVELRFFGGSSMDEIAEILGVSKRTVEGDWMHARAWLRCELSRGEDE